MPAIITMGEALIDFVPGQVDCPLREVRDFHRAPGGAPANVAVGVARLGLSAGFMGKVGDDAFGHFLQQTLDENNVDTSEMVLTREAMTTLAFVSLRSDGERDFAFYRKPGADMLYRTTEVDLEYLQGSRIFHFGSISLIDEPSRTTTLDLVQKAQEAGLVVSFDPNIRPPLWDSMERAVREIREAAPLADVIKVSEEELARLTGREGAGSGMVNDDFQAACEEIHSLGPELVAATMGPNGSYYHTRSCSGHVPGFTCQAIDTTGAGDGFMAGLLCRFLEMGFEDPAEPKAEDWREIFTFANRVGAITTTKNGGIPSLPSRNELEQR